MESQKPKVAMYVKRSFGEKLNASFDFIKEPYSGIELERADGRSAENICSGQYYCHGCQSEFLSGIHVLLRSIYACLYDRDYLIDFLDLCNDPDL